MDRPTVRTLLAALERKGTRRNREGMARYGIVAAKVFGVSVKEVQAIAKRVGRDHALARALFATGWFEARLLAAFIEDPAVLTKAEMDAWARAFENWADCDTAVMHCFDRSPHAWAMTAKWVKAKDEFVKRAGFAMLASMALHHKTAPSAPFIKALASIERAADDDRHFVRKAVNWALRAIGSRDALRQLRTAATMKRVARGELKSGRAGTDTEAARQPVP